MKILLFFVLQILSPLEKIQKMIDSFQQDDDIKSGTVAISINSTKSGETKLQYNAQKSVNSASILKLVSTSTALTVLGVNFRYSTFLEYDGEIENGVLKGNLYVRGTGDPSFGSSRISFGFEQILTLFAQKIKDMGIQRIEGNIVGDDSIFPTKNIADTWIWGDLGYEYSAGVSGLNVNENMYQVVFKPSQTVGNLASILKFQPEIPNLVFENNVFSGERNSDENINVYTSPLDQHIVFDGTVPSNENEFSLKGALPNPPFMVAFYFQKKIEELGIQTSKPIVPYATFRQQTSFLTLPRKIIYQYQSPPLAELMKFCNYESINLYADCFLKTVGYKLSKDASFDSSIKSLKQFWRQKNIDLQGFMIKDGSGLSPSGVLTAKNMTDILGSMSKDAAFQDFYNSIPLVGINGTVQYLCKGTNAVGNVRVKSGSFQNTRAYAGYFTATNGDLMSFAFIVNRYMDGSDKKVKQFLEKLMISMVEI